jgi:ATP-dependent DNA helicase PIF1
LINGRTIHSYLGIGLAKDSPTDLARKLFFKNKQKVADLQELQILLIDEISMLDGDLLHKISTYLTLVRNCNKPFGGLQLILSGDFYQLPPVNGPFAFKSQIWPALNFSCHVLTKIYRQEGDTVFQGILERAKNSSISDEDIRILKSCKGLHFKTDVKPTSLYSVNATVDVINTREYDLLKGAEMVYNTIYANKESKTYCDNTKIPTFVKLKVGAQIMVTRNVNTELKLANGTRGVVTRMYNDTIVINTLYGERVITFYDCAHETDKRISYAVMPIALAWAVTIHKSQGITLDCCIIDIGESLFACGQAYTALSRVKSLNGLRVVNVTKSAFKTHPDVIEFYKAMQK